MKIVTGAIARAFAARRAGRRDRARSALSVRCLRARRRSADGVPMERRWPSAYAAASLAE
ncbi:hypothetical protein BURPS1710A_A1419 [Burkholderia pseudomallei 1710a]|uniref:Uncharacterized protein n=1 Tax=Burkholderia pseudomallei 1710a TaxID=320371 RepID=A0A0E1W325_BURPE|nr:hypothetical protein BURPS1710A_A1419 [Burkholderia pseudomallei 1710a]